MKKNLLLLPSALLTLLFIMMIPPGAKSFAAGMEKNVPDTVALKDMITRLEKDTTPEALYHLSTLYEHGYHSIAPDSIRALALLKESAMRGFAPAQNYLAFRLYPLQPDSALYWFNRAADSGDLKAMSNLGYLLLQSEESTDSASLAENHARAIDLLTRAAAGGVAPAMASLADIYREGAIVAPDTLKAEELYLNAVRHRLGDAEMKLLAMNHNRYKSYSPETALAEGIRAAEAGAATVAFNLFNIAAEGDIPKAYTLLADAYSSAKGTDYNHEAALTNYVSGALGGDPSAQFILAELLEIFPDALNGKLPEGAPAELSTPAYWYELAAEAGVSSAREAARRLWERPAAEEQK